MKKHKPTHEKSSLYADLIDHRAGGGKTGYDPIATGLETSYAQGRFIRALFTGRLRTRNRFMQGLLLLFGVLLLLPLGGLLDTGNVLGLRPPTGAPSVLGVLAVSLLGALLLYSALMSIRHK